MNTNKANQLAINNFDYKKNLLIVTPQPFYVDFYRIISSSIVTNTSVSPWTLDPSKASKASGACDQAQLLFNRVNSQINYFTDLISETNNVIAHLKSQIAMNSETISANLTKIQNYVI